MNTCNHTSRRALCDACFTEAIESAQRRGYERGHRVGMNDGLDMAVKELNQWQELWENRSYPRVSPAHYAARIEGMKRPYSEPFGKSEELETRENAKEREIADQ